MAFQKQNKYWKIVDMKIDRQLKTANITFVGFKDEEDANKPKLAQFIPGYPKQMIKLEKELYPFVSSAEPNQTAMAYVNVKKVSKFFADAKDV